MRNALSVSTREAYINCEEVISPNLHRILGEEWVGTRGSSVCCRSTAMRGHYPGKGLKLDQLGTKWEGGQASHQLPILTNAVGYYKILVFIGDDCENMISRLQQ